MDRLGVALAFVVSVFFAGNPVSAQQTSRCADCHYAQGQVPAPDHLFAWDRSPHASNNVGCDKCHGGNSTVFEATLAHRGILNSVEQEEPGVPGEPARDMRRMPRWPVRRVPGQPSLPSC